ncbi:MAG: hypothetical protein ACOC0Z_08615 [Halohasta sp.]
MTQQPESEAKESSNTVFVAVGLVLVALSSVVTAAVVWYTVDVAALAETVNPAVIGTIVFSLAVAVAASRSTNFTSYLTTKNRSGQ